MADNEPDNETRDYSSSTGAAESSLAMRGIGFLPCLRGWLIASLVCSIAGCVVVPLPATENEVVSGVAVTQDEIDTLVANGENLKAVKTRFGDPIFDFGPGRVLVYGWTVDKGDAYWLLYNSFGSFPLHASSLMVFAFDAEGSVSKAGILDFKPAQTVSKQVREWLAAEDPEYRFAGPRIEQAAAGIPLLFAYRPRSAGCPALSYDADTFKPSISVNGIFLGDVSRGEYLGAELEAGEYDVLVTLSPLHLSAYISPRLRPTSISVDIGPERPVYIETYLCTGSGDIEMKAVAGDPATVQEIFHDLKPAW